MVAYNPFVTASPLSAATAVRRRSAQPSAKAVPQDALQTRFSGQAAPRKSVYEMPQKSLYNDRRLQLAPALFGKVRFGWDPNSPLQKLLRYSMDPGYHYDSHFAWDHMIHGQGTAHWKKWILAHPAELLRRNVADTVNIMKDIVQRDIQDFNASPDYGNTWGRRANYIELVPRVLGKLTDNGNQMREGILGAIKMLPAIPASQDGIANCVVLNGLFPTIYGDGWAKGHEEQSSLYTSDFKFGYSKDLFPDEMDRNGVKMSQEDFVKAFNDLAHMRGLKTGFFMVLSDGQMRRDGQNFNWNDHTEDFINSAVHAVKQGFDAIYFDSAKHVGWYDMGSYCGVGGLPDYGKMQYITHEIRLRSGRPDLAIAGERCDMNIGHFKGMGMNAGLTSVHPSERDIARAADVQNGSHEYAAGAACSDDNDGGGIGYDDRIARITAGLFASRGKDKLPFLMTMPDLFPLNWGTNMHDLMQHNRHFSHDGTPDGHWNNTFAGDDGANYYRRKVNEQFAWAAGQ